MCLAVLLSCQLRASDAFVYPGNGMDRDVPVWGHRDGLQVGTAPTPGPHGLIRVFAPHVGIRFPSRINYLSIEPTTRMHRDRNQSELAISRHRHGQRGLQFFPSNSLTRENCGERPATGIVSQDGKTLRVFIHTERFPNGAMPIVEVIFHADKSDEVELRTHQASEGEPMTECVLSATMGNFAMVRTIHLPSGVVHHASGLWGDETKDHLGFLPWRDWAIFHAAASPEVTVRFYSEASSAMEYPRRVPKRWRYPGVPSVQSWRVVAKPETYVAVNGRDTYWGIGVPIPEGTSIENFEVRRPFVSGQSAAFGVQPAHAAQPTDPGIPQSKLANEY